MFSPATIAATVSEFVGILEPAVGQIANQAGASQPLVAKVTAGIEGLKTSAAALATSDVSAATQPIAQRVVADGSAVLNALTLLPLPLELEAPVRIASMVFGFLPGIIGILFPPHAAAAPAPAPAPAAPVAAAAGPTPGA